MLIKSLRYISVVILSINVTFFGEVGTKPIANAQIAPDSSLGKERSQVTNRNNIQEIRGGARRGKNLFHSFQEFGIPQGRSAYFIPQGNITNIFSRVTGKNISNIQGILGVRGSANLFLLNPNGIIFGRNAKLDLKGSFIGSTGESFLFENGSEFSANNPQGVPILTVNVVQPVGIKFGNQPGIILNQSQQGLGVDSGKTLGLFGAEIQIEEGKITAPTANIVLGAVAGNNTINLTETSTGGYSASYDGVKDFGDVSFSGSAIVETTGIGSVEIQGKNISLTEGSQINSISGDETGGSINIIGKEIKVTGINTSIKSESSGKGVGADIAIEGERLITTEGGEISATVTGSGKGGNLQVKATESVELSQVAVDAANKIYYSGLKAQVLGGATGNAGDISIETGKLDILSGGQISAATFGDGAAGNLQIAVSGDINITGTVLDSQGNLTSRSGIFAEVYSPGKGNGGNVTINTSKLFLAKGGRISASTFSSGNAGSLEINANKQINATGIEFNEFGNPFISGLFAQVGTGVSGNGGNLTINTAKLTISDGGQVSAATFGSGNAGSVLVNATEQVKATGVIFNNKLFISHTSGIFARVQVNANGNAGNLTINTPQLFIYDGAVISASTFGMGNAGSMLLNATKELRVQGAQFDQETTRLSLSFISAEVNSGAIGKSGNLIINTEKLTLSDGGQISASVYGDGREGTGSLRVNATEEVKISGFALDNTGRAYISGLLAQVGNVAQGNGGNLTINTKKLTISEAGAITASTAGRGDAGNVMIKATDALEITGVVFDGLGITRPSGVFARVQPGASGKGGDLTIATKKLQVSDGGQITASTIGLGDAGNLRVNATQEVTLTGVGINSDGNFSASGLYAEVNTGATGKGGNLTINTKKLNLNEGGKISASTFAVGNAGSLRVNATEEINITDVAFNSDQTRAFIGGVFAQAYAGSSGNGGNLIINTPKLLVSTGGQITASTAGQGNGGDVRINATDTVTVTGVAFVNNGVPQTSGILARVYQTGSGLGGNLNIKTTTLQVSDGGVISASTLGLGDAGSLRINATKEIEVTGIAFDPNSSLFNISQLDAQVFAQASGKGGNLTINTDNLLVTDGAQITAASSSSSGIAGNININASDITLDNQALIITNTQQGNGGNITITAGNILSLYHQSNISATAGNDQNGGDGGNININAEFIVANPFQNSNISANAFSGSGGRVNIDTKGLFGIQANSVDTDITSDITASSANGPQGTVVINNPNVQPKTGLINLTSQPIVFRFVRLCENRNKGQTLEFFNIGRGGEIPFPEEFLLPEIINNPWVELINQNPSQNTSTQGKTSLGFDSMAVFLPCQ